jgi:hypothetical protein
MGLQDSFNEFKEFEASVDEMRNKISSFVDLVDCSIRQKLINPNIAMPEICVEGYVLSIPDHRLYLKYGLENPNKKEASRTMNVEEVVQLYKLLPRIIEEFSKILIDQINKDVEGRMKRFESFIFEHSV